jgi:hypothetical protein
MAWVLFAVLSFITFVYGDDHRERDSEPKQRGWCATGSPHGRSLKRQQQSCGLMHRCDDSVVRDAYLLQASSPTLTLRLKFIIFGQGPSAGLLKNISAVMDTTTTAYAPARVSFNYTVDYYPSVSFPRLSATDAISISDMKKKYSNNSGAEMNIFVPTLSDGVLGFAIFPTDPSSLGPGGGVVITYPEIKAGAFTVPHELGHALGLLHTFEGAYTGSDGKVSSPCDPCAEFAGAASDSKGDMCSDTAPTLENFKCADPENPDCRNNGYKNTDYLNYMGYADNNCLLKGHFSTQQIARMRCFMERILSPLLATSRTCQVPADCDDANNCTFETCVNGGCQTRVTNCDNSTVPCKDNVCDPKDGVCKLKSKTCSAPTSLPCANAACNLTENSCKTDFTPCSAGGHFENDCCKTTDTPFCNDSSIMNCVCSHNDYCCLKSWNQDCYNLVAHCSDTRDCIAETLPSPTNLDCETAAPLEDIIFKASTDDNEAFECVDLGISIKNYHGAWFRASGDDYSDVMMSTDFIESAVNTEIYIFDACKHCISKASSTGNGNAKASFTMAPGVNYWFYVGSAQLGAIRVDFNTTAVDKSTIIPLGAIVAIAVLGAVAVIIVILIAYVCLQDNPYADVP